MCNDEDGHLTLGEMLLLACAPVLIAEGAAIYRKHLKRKAKEERRRRKKWRARMETRITRVERELLEMEFEGFEES